MIEQTVIAGGFRTRYLEAGHPSSPVILLLHDGAWGGSSSATWGNAIPLLAESYHVFAPDLLGFGGTDKVVFFDRSTYEPRIAHLLAFLDVVGVDGPVHVVGNSFGGSLALRMLAEDTDGRVRSVVSVNGTGGPWRSPAALTELARWDGTRQDLERVVGHLIETFDGWDAHLDERMRWAAAPGHFRAVASVAVPIPEPLREERSADDWPAALARGNAPVLLVSGSRDTLLEPGWTEHFAFLGERLRAVELDATHEPNIDRPDDLVPVLLHFLSGETRLPTTTMIKENDDVYR